MNATNGYNFEPHCNNHDGFFAQTGNKRSSNPDEFSSPLEILAASLNLPTYQDRQSNPSSSTSSTNLQSVLNSNAEKVSDLDMLVGEFNDLMTQLQEPPSPTRLNVSPVPPRSDLNDLLNKEERSQEVRDHNRTNAPHPADCELNPLIAERRLSDTDDDAMIATIRTLSEMQIDATSSAETGAIQNEITAQMMHMYSNNVRKISTPDRIPNRIPGRSSLDLNVLSYRDQNIPNPDRNVPPQRNITSISPSSSPQKRFLSHRPLISSSVLFPSSASGANASTYSAGHVGWDSRIRNSASPDRTEHKNKKGELQVL